MALPQAGLRLDRAPPVAVPFRFFLTAPLFLVLAAGVLLWRAPEAMSSRLSPAALAATHLFTVGFMSMVMIGALMQILPVLAGVSIPRPRAVAAAVHAALVAGTLSLACGFLAGSGGLLVAGAVLLSAGIAVFLAAVAAGLWRAHLSDSTIGAVSLAALCLAVTALLGLLLALSLGRGTPLFDASMLDLHPAWGLFGWAGLLVIGVAYRVVPMFYTTSKYPFALRASLVPGLFALLILWSAAEWAGAGSSGVLAAACAAALPAGYVLFAAVTAELQRRRKRRLPDVMVDFWRIGMLSLMLAGAIRVFGIVSPSTLPEAAGLIVGVLALPGFAGAIINGMLYKIVPFLAWYHLQLRSGGRPVPNMKQMIGDARQRLQFRVAAAALALLALSPAWPDVLVVPAALATIASAVLLEANLLKVRRTMTTASGSGPVEQSLGARWAKPRSGER